MCKNKLQLCTRKVPNTHLHLHHHCCDTKWFAEVEVSQRTAAAHHNHKINHNTHGSTHTRLPTHTHTLPLRPSEKIGLWMRNKLRLIKHKSHSLFYVHLIHLHQTWSLELRFGLAKSTFCYEFILKMYLFIYLFLDLRFWRFLFMFLLRFTVQIKNGLSHLRKTFHIIQTSAQLLSPILKWEYLCKFDATSDKKSIK